MDIDEETSSQYYSQEEKDFFNRDLKKPLLVKMMGDDYKKFFN